MTGVVTTILVSDYAAQDRVSPMEKQKSNSLNEAAHRARQAGLETEGVTRLKRFIFPDLAAERRNKGKVPAPTIQASLALQRPVLLTPRAQAVAA